MHLYSLLFLAVCLNYLFIGICVFAKDYYEVKNRIFFNVAFFFAFWAAVNSVMFLITDPEIASSVRKFQSLSWGTIYSIILHFVLHISRQDRHIINRPIIGYSLIYMPSLVNIYLYFFNPYTSSEMTLTNTGWIIQWSLQRGFMWDYYFYIYYVCYCFISIFMIIRWIRKTEIRREKIQAHILLWTMIFSFIAGSLLEIILPINGILVMSGITTIIALVPFYGLWYSSEKLGMMSFKEEKLRPDILKMMDEGILIHNNSGEIIMKNKGAKKMLGYESEDDFEHIDELLITSDPFIQEPTRFSSKPLNLKAKTGDSISTIASNMPLYDSLGDKYGNLTVFRDISEIKKIQKKLVDINESLETRIEERTKDLIEINENLHMEILERQRAEKKAMELAYYDKLTGLPNLRHFKEHIEESISSSNKYKTKFAILFLDLDLFKRINDTLGHTKGDEVLIQVAKRLQRNLRKIDFLSRIGGDEFLIIIDKINDYEEAEIITNRITTCFKEPFNIDDNAFVITCSIGMSMYPDHGKTIVDLHKYADIAMYHAKETGRNKVIAFDENMKTDIIRELNLTNDLFSALENDEFELYYQPQVNTSSERITGLEALIRWNHPKLGFLTPNNFIPLAEKSGKINDIGRWVINRAGRDLKRWRDMNLMNDISVSLNISVSQFSNFSIVEYTKEIIKKYDLNPKNIEFEVTESIVMEIDDNLLEILKQLKDIGIRISIDDFGVEYSSLRYIKSLPIDIIKIDKSFIDGIGLDMKDEAIIKTIVTLAHNLGLKTIAEGVEHIDQVNFINNANCDTIQGYYYYKPMKISDIEKFLH